MIYKIEVKSFDKFVPIAMFNNPYHANSYLNFLILEGEVTLKDIRRVDQIGTIHKLLDSGLPHHNNKIIEKL